jgi:hypothetical protein
MPELKFEKYLMQSWERYMPCTIKQVTANRVKDDNKHYKLYHLAQIMGLICLNN